MNETDTRGHSQTTEAPSNDSSDASGSIRGGTREASTTGNGPCVLDLRTVKLNAGNTLRRRHLEEAESEVARELGVRERCYDTWIKGGKLSRIDANDRFTRLTFAHKILLAALDVWPDPEVQSEQQRH